MPLSRALYPFRLPLAGLLVTLLALLPAAHADDTATLSLLRDQQLGLYTAMRNFHMLTLLSGDPERDARLRATVTELGKSFDALPKESSNAALATALATVRKEWPLFRKQALANNVARDGDTDTYVIIDMRAANSRLQAALAQAVAAIPASGKRKQSDQLQATALLVQKITNEYVHISASIDGGMSLASGEGEQLAIDKLTPEVDKQVARQLADFSGNPAVLEAVRSVSSKWGFVRGSLLDLKNQSVPFVVDRYSTQINDSYRLAIKAIEDQAP